MFTYTSFLYVSYSFTKNKSLLTFNFLYLSLGMLLRFFMNFYDMEVVEEEAFLKWKEEVNDQYPGKGKALFQVS